MENLDKIITEKCYNKAYEIYGENLPKAIKERLELELNSIIKNNFESKYLISSELVKKSNELGYGVWCRGSIGNSFVAYLLEITNYNPIDYNLPFELFAGITYDKEPDINLIFSSEIGEKICSYAQEKYGRDKVILDGTTGTFENCKFYIIEHDNLAMLHELEKLTNVKQNTINFNDKETLNLFLHVNDTNYNNSLKGIPDFSNEMAYQLLESIKPKNFNDLVCILGLLNGTYTWKYNAEDLIKNKGIEVDKVISNRADMFNFLLEKGIDKETAFKITELVRQGKPASGRSLWQNIRDKYKDINEEWAKYRKIMEEYNVPEWYMHSAEIIKYLFPKSHLIGYTINAFKIAWYKVHYPEEFYKAYFKIESELNIEEYYNRKQVKRELNRLYDEKEIYENNKKYEYDINNDYKIEDLEILLEMYNRGFLQEKTEIKDDYNLINSRAIADYCRSIKHKFNTEELAVLVYRNKRMSIDEKITKYEDLIKNYPDMEVIKRINCEHYDSVKTMIKNEIERLNDLKEKFEKDEESAIYSYEMCYKSTQKWDTLRGLFENIRRTLNEIETKIDKYIKEYDDTLAYRIIKRYFNDEKPVITAEYQVFENKKILTNIYDSQNNFLDIDNIFLDIPTPFKRGDILVSWEQLPYREGITPENVDIFVLDYLCTWSENLEKRLNDGWYDSSDMIGYGYYLYDENATEFIRDHKWDYDSFEYYDDELTKNKRVLKDISSFLKDKISLELFVHAYDAYKAENSRTLPDYYTDDGLRLAGFTESDIRKENYDKR